MNGVVAGLQLRTLGGLSLVGSEFRRGKPLLLAAYLCIEGPQTRGFVSKLFWPKAPNPRTDLSVALNMMRKSNLNLIGSDDTRIWATVNCDAVLLKESLRAGKLEAAQSYPGAFAQGLDFSDIDAELEEWVHTTTESLAQEVRSALIVLGERKAREGGFAEAAAWAEQAYRPAGSGFPSPEDLFRIHRLLLAAEHPRVSELQLEAQDFEVGLTRSAAQARAQLRQSMIGRTKELEMLLGLEVGQWAWVAGGQGMGKTTLLRAAATRMGWRFLMARSGLALATIAPLVDTLDGGSHAVLRRLSRLEESFVVDDWEQVDPESKELLIKLRDLRPEIVVVLAGQAKSPVAVDVTMELDPLSPQDLRAHPKAYEATDGIPRLVDAWVRGEPLDRALEPALNRLKSVTQQIYFALALLEEPGWGLAREALQLSPTDVALAQEQLLGAGLVEPSGQVRSRRVVLEYLDNRPSEGQRIALELARCLPVQDALGLYQKARALWEASDLPKVEEAYIWQGKELLWRGYPQQAVQALQDAPKSDAVLLLKARAAERSGDYREGLRLLDELFQSETLKEEVRLDALGLKSAVLWRTQKVDDAEPAAKEALKGSMWARAEAQNALGSVAWARGDFAEAERQYARAANSWLAVGERSRYLEALNNRAVVISEQGEHAQEAFELALAASEDYLPVRALLLLNIAHGFARKKQYKEAIEYIEQALSLSLEAGAYSTAAAAWRNLGDQYIHMGKRKEAREVFVKALVMAEQVGDRRLIGLGMFNLADFDQDEEAIEQALIFLENAGYSAEANRLRKEV